ncbi:MAG: helix-turn-helix domain-containing protein [Anaerolineae bacterium]
MKDRVVDERKPGWYWVDNQVIETYGRTIGPYGVAVYSVIAKYANAATREAFPGAATIAENLGISRTTVQKTIERLEAAGLIVISHSKGRYSNTYTLVNRPPRGQLEPDQEVNRPPRGQLLTTTRAVTDHHVVSNCPPRGQEQDSYNKTHITRPIEQDDEDPPAESNVKSSSSSSWALPALDSLDDLIQEFGKAAVNRAQEIARNAGRGDSLRYVAGVLRNQKREGTLGKAKVGRAHTDPFDY